MQKKLDTGKASVLVLTSATKSFTAGLLLLASVSRCSPVAESILKTSRFASERPSNTHLSNPGQQANDQSADATLEAPDKTLTFEYISLVVDAAASTIRELIEEIPTDEDTSSSGPTHCLNSLSSSRRTYELTLNDDLLDQFRENGHVSFEIPLPGVGKAIQKITARFHVIQSEFELIEADASFNTALALQAGDANAQAELRLLKSGASDFDSASTLSRLVKVELAIEATPLGPLAPVTMSDSAK